MKVIDQINKFMIIINLQMKQLLLMNLKMKWYFQQVMKKIINIVKILLNQIKLSILDDNQNFNIQIMID